MTQDPSKFIWETGDLEIVAPPPEKPESPAEEWPDQPEPADN